MRPDARRPRPIPLALLGLALACGGCARERREITPTTLGTDFRRSPRGAMRPFPWPGQDITRTSTRPGPTVDPQAALASAGDRPIP